MGCGASQPARPRQLVLLGGGECGKTTIFKQIQIIHGTGFADTRGEWIEAVHRSPLRSMKVLLGAINEQGIKLDEENQTLTEAMLGPHQNVHVITPEIAADITKLWTDASIQKLVKEQTSLDLDDNAKFFLDKVAELAEPGYKPDTEAILKVRDPTRTIETLDFQVDKAKFRVIDVGGQRMERPKWNLTGDITAVIFVCALTEYNQVLREDIKQNRLKESLNIFDIACNRRYPNKPIILFLNKVDIFREKIKQTDLRVCFATYKGGCNYEAALEFIKHKFMSVRKNTEQQIYVIETTATNTENMMFIIKSMIDIVQRQNLNASGLG